jgi:micrococcal nuclease
MKRLFAVAMFAVAGFFFTGSAAAPSPQQVGTTEYYGSSHSNIYHLPSCRWAQKITPEHLIIFKSREEAEKAGYRPCKVCKP